METNNEMTPQRSLEIINETLEANRKAIIAGSGKYLIMWGCLLLVFSLAVWGCWHLTGSPVWNLLWFAMWPVGLLVSKIVGKGDRMPQNYVSALIGKVWAAFGIFAPVTAALAIIAFPMNITLVIILLFGFAETVSGIALKNWPIIIAGAIVGIGGACAAVALAPGAGQILLFTGAALVLALTGVAIQVRK